MKICIYGCVCVCAYIYVSLYMYICYIHCCKYVLYVDVDINTYIFPYVHL